MNDIWIDIASGKVFGKTEGNGPLILGLHGWSQRNGWHTWEPLMEPLADGGFQVVSVDMPGWGKSPAIQEKPLQPEDAVAIVLEILDELEAPQATLMGKSWGGGIALQVALEHGQRVDKLLLTAPAFRDFSRLTEVKQTVLLAWAEDDSVIPIQYAREYMEKVPDVQLVSYASGGHSAAPRNAADFAAKAINFLKE